MKERALWYVEGWNRLTIYIETDRVEYFFHRGGFERLLIVPR